MIALDSFEKKLADYCAAKGLQCEPFYFEESTHSVAEAAKAAKCREQDLVKNICLVDEAGGLVVAIVRGDKRLDKKKLEELIGGKLVFCTPEQVLSLTGFPAGGVPSLGLVGRGRIFVDSLVAQRDFVLGGGGSARALARVRVADVVADGSAVVVDVALR